MSLNLEHARKLASNDFSLGPVCVFGNNLGFLANERVARRTLQRVMC